MQVVLGNSVIVNANENQNPDLYQALKGGGSNFGTSINSVSPF